jgi:flagellar biosynthesis protein FlhF
VRIRKFQADTMREALLQVKEEMGPEALILRTQKIRGGLLSGGERWEVTAGLEDKFFEKPEPLTGSQSAYGPGARAVPPGTTTRTPAAPSTASQPVWTPDPRPAETRESTAIRDQTAISRDELMALQNGIESVRKAAEAPTQAIALVREEMGQLRSVVSLLADHWKDQAVLPVAASVLPLYQRLVASDLAEDLAREVCEEAAKRLEESGTQDVLQARAEAMRALVRRLPCEPLRFARGQKTRVVLFAGPTGVGKTTTLMKLAVRMSRIDGLRVGIVGCDAYRIGAQEQIGTFADVAGLPLRTVFTDADLDVALTDLDDCDVVLVDTAGRSPANQIHFLELSTLIERIHPTDIVLVQSATTRLRDLSASVRAYRDLGPTRLVFTKIDETESHGALCTLAARERLPVAALCFGQDIPDHISDAVPAELARMVMGD